MKTSFSTLSCMNETPEQVAGLARRHGINAVEIRLDGNGTFNSIYDPSVIRGLLDGIEILSFNTGLTVAPDCDALEKIKKTASFAASCGAGGIRVFADPRGDLARLAESVAASSDAAEREGVKLLIETHGALTSTEEMRVLLDLTDRSFGVIWDVLHTLESGETVAESADNLIGSVAHVHLKDAVKTENGYLMTKLGEGDVKPQAVRKLLDGDAAFSLEWEEFWHEELGGIYRDADELLASYLEWLR